MLLSLRVHLTPREKLDDLLMVALSGDTMTAIRFTTEIIGSGVEPQALMSQLASLIKDLLSTPATVVSRSPSAASGKVEAQPKSFSHQTKNFNSALSDLLKSRRICSGKPITENYQKKKKRKPITETMLRFESTHWSRKAIKIIHRPEHTTISCPATNCFRRCP